MSPPGGDGTGVAVEGISVQTVTAEAWLLQEVDKSRQSLRTVEFQCSAD